MEHGTMVKFVNSYCRICMRTDSHRLTHLFQMHSSQDEVIANMIIDCTDVMIEDDDNFPLHICSVCLSRLTSAYELRQQCKASEVAFQTLIREAEAALDSGSYKKLADEECYTVFKLLNTNEPSCRCKNLPDKKFVKLHEHCTFCKKPFFRQRTLAGNRRQFFTCKICDVICFSEYDINTHVNQKRCQKRADEGESQTDVALQTLETEAEYLEDEECNEGIANLSTDSCGYQMYKIKHGDQPPAALINFVANCGSFRKICLKAERCCGCLGYFKTEHELMLHCTLEHPERDEAEGQLECVVCNFRFHSEATLKIHQMLSEVKDYFHCLTCDFTFNYDRFQQHNCTDTITACANYTNANTSEDVQNDCDNGQYAEQQVEIMQIPEQQQCVDPKEYYECTSCYERFLTLEQLDQHHDVTGDRSVTDNTQLTMMETQATSSVPLSPTFCIDSAQMATVQTPEQDEQLTDLEEIHECPDCSERFKTLEQFAEHQRFADHQCAPNSTNQMTEEVQNLTENEVNHQCCVLRCNKQFQDMATLMKHMDDKHKYLRLQNRQCREYQEHVCSFCQRGFPNENLYAKHVSARKKSEHICGKCGATYASAATLEIHTRSNCGKDALHTCGICGKTYFTANGYNYHMKRHISDLRPFACTICKRQFRRKSSLREHQTVHTNERLYKCSQCPSTFRIRGTLLAHERVHTGEKRYECRHCDKRYLNSSDRNIHEMAIHHKIKPFKCSFCDSTFVRNRERMLHERTHTGTTLYCCTSCGVGFNKLADLKLHDIVQHGPVSMEHSTLE